MTSSLLLIIYPNIDCLTHLIHYIVTVTPMLFCLFCFHQRAAGAKSNLWVLCGALSDWQNILKFRCVYVQSDIIYYDTT